MTDSPCRGCDRPVADHAPLCVHCGGRIVDALNAVPGLLDEFAVTRAGLARMTSRQVGRTADPALPVRVTTGRGVVLEGDRARHQLVNTVTTWARLLAEELAVEPHIGGRALIDLTDARRDLRPADRTAAALAPPPPELTAQAAVWLAHHRHQLRAHEAAEQLLDEITAAVTQLTRYVDRPVERRRLGACAALLDSGDQCGFGLYAELDEHGRTAAYAYCGRCRAQYDVRQIESAAAATAAEQCYSLAELMRLLPALGQPVAKATLYRWAGKERRVEPRGWRHASADGRARITDHRIADEDVQVYRLGDILELAKREPKHRKGAA